jgi:hypothetical protein
MALQLGTPMPSLAGVTEWINGEPDWSELNGVPVLVHFWAASCQICHDNMATILELRDTYAARGLRVIGIHLPREREDGEIARVREQVARLKITDPCGVDNAAAVADAFDSRYLPAYFLFDRSGLLRSRATGDAGLGLLKGALARQFGER